MHDQSLREQRKAFRRAQRHDFFQKRKRSGSIMAGLLVLFIGVLLLTKELGVPYPTWLFTWPMLLISFGLLAGACNAFRDPGWVIITGVGAVFLLQKIWPDIQIYKFIWPVLIIVIGFMIILAPRRHRNWHTKWQQWKEMQESGNQFAEQPITPPGPEGNTAVPPYSNFERKKGDNWLDVVTIFGGAKKLIYSKSFKGGDVVSIFGGTEINLSQADFTGEIVIELVQVFGGAKLIIPPHWQIRSEMVAFFGGIDDKRTPQPNYDSDKVIVLNGITFFGGIEIKSF